MKKYLLLQKEGLTGKLGEISAWLDKKDNAWLLSGGDHGWEEVPYWLKGYGNLAYILKDTAMINETKVWIEAAIRSQQADGYFGPVNERKEGRELWANMIMLWCLQSYYEYSGDERVISLMTNYFKWQMTVPDEKFLKDYWENSRGGDNLYSVYWLYNITGDKFLLELAEKLHRNTANWTNDSALPNWHNVNIAQCFREPATYYMLTGDSADLKASYRVHHLVRRIFGQVPGGMFGADENARLAYIDPRQGTETCGFVEQMASDELMLRMTGDPFWAEHCEDVAFNSYPAAVMSDFKALRYITCPNQVVSDSKNHRPGIDNGGPFLAMNPFSSRCCQHNHAQGWPYYIENLVYATPDNGLAAIIYGPCEAQAKVGDKGTVVTLKEETNYPFEESVRFVLEAEENVIFPLYLRIPAWCKEAKVLVNGAAVKASMEPGKYIRLCRTWNSGDIVTLQLPMSLSVKRWEVNQNSASVNYGPLTFSLLIEEEYRKVNSAETAIWDSKWQADADVNAWPTYEIYPQSAWNYALTLDASVLFDVDESELTDAGKEALRNVLPIYCKVLMEDTYKNYLAEIIIDGYTDTDGDYAYNLELSQQRSLAVAQYLLDIQGEFLTEDQSLNLQDYLTVNGHSMANPILDADGNVDKEASRRVEVKFRLKDDEMIEELSKIMAGSEESAADTATEAGADAAAN